MSKLNIAGPETINEMNETIAADCNRPLDLVDEDDDLLPWVFPHYRAQSFDTLDRLLWVYRRSLLTHTSSFEWLRTTARRHHISQPKIRLIIFGLTAFYAPDLNCLAPSREGLSMHLYRIWTNISNADPEAIVDRVEDILRRDDIWTSDDTSWPSIADQIVETWSDRILQVKLTLNNPELNASAVVREVQLLAYTLIDPYLDTTVLPHRSESEPALWLPPTMQRFIGPHTGFILPAQLTEEERLLRNQLKLCQVEYASISVPYSNNCSWESPRRTKSPRGRRKPVY